MIRRQLVPFILASTMAALTLTAPMPSVAMEVEGDRHPAKVETEETVEVMAEDEAEGPSEDLTASWIEYDNRPVLMETTGYCEGTITYSGEHVRPGIVAAAPEWIGQCCVMYEAIPDGDGYAVGGYIGTYEILDTGYGRDTGDGIQSRIRPDKASRGTIEVGRSIDVWYSSLPEVTEWMRRTGGMAYVQILPGKG